jgi:hypothetical protein
MNKKIYNMKKIILQTAAILLIIAGIISCGKEDKEEPIKLAGTYWWLDGIVNVETGDVIHVWEACVGCFYLYFDTDSTAPGKSVMNEIDLHLFPQLYVVITINTDDSSGNYYIQLFYDAIKTVTSYTVTKDELGLYLKLYCNEGKKYLLYKEIPNPNLNL